MALPKEDKLKKADVWFIQNENGSLSGKGLIEF
jgi:hypothetical protein